MKYDISALTFEVMFDLLKRHFDIEAEIDEVKFNCESDYVSIWLDDEADIVVYDTGEIRSTYLIPEMEWEIWHKLRTCKNCKYWDEGQCEVQRPLRDIDHLNWYYKNYKDDSIFPVICNMPIRVDLNVSRDESVECTANLSADDLESNVVVYTGASFSCLYHKPREI